MQHDLGIFAAKAFNRIDLDHRRGFRHDNHRFAFEFGAGMPRPARDCPPKQ